MFHFSGIFRKSYILVADITKKSFNILYNTELWSEVAGLDWGVSDLGVGLCVCVCVCV